MALYDYECACGAMFSRQFPMGTAPADITVKCFGGQAVAKRVITAPSVHIPGGTNAGYVKR